MQLLTPSACQGELRSGLLKVFLISLHLQGQLQQARQAFSRCQGLLEFTPLTNHSFVRSWLTKLELPRLR
jgi:hypothetical protein